jgi:hypothetical protein
MKKITLILMLLILLSLDGNARSYSAWELSGCWNTKDSSTILHLYPDGKFTIQYAGMSKVMHTGRWTISNKNLILNRETPVYHPLEGRGLRDWDVKVVKVRRKHKLLWGYMLKPKIFQPGSYRKGRKIYMRKESDMTKISRSLNSTQ